MLDEVLRAIAEPRRRRILELVQRRELSVGEIAAQFEVTGPAISQHLHVLVDAGLVTGRREGTRHLYRARPEGLADVKRFVETFWEDRLISLKHAAEAEERRRTRREAKRN